MAFGENYSQFFALAIGIALAIVLAVYIYFAFAWMRIAKKMKYKRPWLAFIPFANVAMWLQMGGFHWAFIFLALIPLVGWLVVFAFFIISTWRVYEQLGYDGYLSLAPIIDLFVGGLGTLLYAIISGIVAWGKDKKKKRRR